MISISTVISIERWLFCILIDCLSNFCLFQYVASVNIVPEMNFCPKSDEKRTMTMIMLIILPTAVPWLLRHLTRRALVAGPEQTTASRHSNNCFASGHIHIFTIFIILEQAITSVILHFILLDIVTVSGYLKLFKMNCLKGFVAWDPDHE